MAQTDKLAPATKDWLTGLGFVIKNEAVWVEALTHGSTGEVRDYDRLEFLGDRVLGLVIAEWLYIRNTGQEGQLAQRLNVLVNKQTCADVAREIGVAKHVRLGKQARDDGAADSDNVLGDIMEALLGASQLESGYNVSRELLRKFWKDAVGGNAGVSKHPKSALQEWAAGNQRRSPEYQITNRSGPDHASRFTVEVTIYNVGSIEAEAGSRREAEAEAAKLFMEKFG